METPEQMIERVRQLAGLWTLETLDRAALRYVLEQADSARQLAEALSEIRGTEIKPDDDGLIEDSVCVYCDSSSLDGCDEDCPRTIAESALAATPAQNLAKVRADHFRQAAEHLVMFRVCREQYGHAKAAVTLDVEALNSEADRIEAEAAR